MKKEKTQFKRLNKTIWFLWLQGVDKMPPIVKICYESWVKQNQDWRIIVLSYKNIKEQLKPHIYKLIERKNISNQAISDIIRINLLKENGGVWVDATCYSIKPLDTWLPNYFNTNFFAFRSPKRKKTIISSWFLVSCKNEYIVSKYCELTNDFWFQNPYLKPWNKIAFWRLSFKLIRLNRYLDDHPQLWFSYFLLKTLKLHSYYWFHYLFEKLLIEDGNSKKIWNKTNYFSSDVPHLLQIHGLNKNLTNDIKNRILKKEDPFYKLNWRVKICESPVLEFLISNHNNLNNSLSVTIDKK